MSSCAQACQKKKEEKEKILGIIIGNSKIINQQDNNAVVKTNNGARCYAGNPLRLPNRARTGLHRGAA